MNALTSMQSVAEQPLLKLTLRHVTVILDHAHHRTAQVRRVADVTRARVGCALEQEVDDATQRKTVQEKRSAYYTNMDKLSRKYKNTFTLPHSAVGHAQTATPTRLVHARNHRDDVITRLQ